MNKLLVLVLCALACSTNALYHFSVNLPDPCDILLEGVMLSGDTKTVGTVRVHGTFIELSGKMIMPEMPEIETHQLVRPDTAEPGKTAKVYGWTPFSCDSSQIENSMDLFSMAELDYTNKESADFHGIKCTVIYNATDPDEMRYYVDEKTRILYGITAYETDVYFKYTKATDNSPEKFAFDKKAQPSCEDEAYVPPTADAYVAACKRTGPSFNVLLRSFVKNH